MASRQNCFQAESFTERSSLAGQRARRYNLFLMEATGSGLKAHGSSVLFARGTRPTLASWKHSAASRVHELACFEQTHSRSTTSVEPTKNSNEVRIASKLQLLENLAHLTMNHAIGGHNLRLVD